MKLYGLDFTSAPSKRKPITCAACTPKEGRLELLEITALTSFANFESFLASKGPWLAGIDAPLGQPRKLIENLELPQNWAGYVAHFGAMSKADFVATLDSYRAGRPVGDKEHRRRVDELARAISPMKLYGVPVGKMFFELAPRLLKSPLNLPLLRPTLDTRTVLETYPALVARRFIGRQSYKSDTPNKQTDEHREARVQIVQGLLSDATTQRYGVRVNLTADQQQDLISDPRADVLDAFLCALQVAWASLQPNYGISEGADGLEGWMADPEVGEKKKKKEGCEMFISAAFISEANRARLKKRIP